MAVATERDEAATRASLAAWLAARTGADRVDVGPLTIPGLSGFSNETLLFTAAWGGEEHPLVVRVEPSGHQVFPSTEFEAQAKVMRALHAEGSVPVPEVLWFEEDRTILGDRFIAMPRVDGQVPADNPSYHVEGWVADLTDGQRTALWMSATDTMVAIHDIDRGAVGLDWIEVRSPQEQLALDLDYRHFAAGDAPYPVVDRAYEVLGASVPPPPEAPALCWGDSRVGNMIFASDCTVAAVLDWEMVTVGDPVQDVAWNLLLDRHHHEAFGVPRLSGLPDREATVARWEAASGRSAEHFDWYLLLGAARYATIMTRVLKLLDASGTFPGAADMAFDQTGSQLLERLLDERS